MEIKKLDFSHFHPLDHWPGTAYCRQLPGGTANHLRMTWEFRRREQALTPLYWLLLCRIGRHKVQVWYSNRGHVQPRCAYCHYSRLPSEAEIDARDGIPWGPP